MAQNVITFDDIKKSAIELGEMAGKGKNVQSQFALKLIEGGYHGALDLTKDKHGQGIDDAQLVSEIYVKAQDKTTIFDSRAANQQKLMSCSRKLIQVGGFTKGGSGEPLATVNNLMTLWSKERQKPQSRGKLDDAFNTLMKFAREQLKRDQIIPQNELLNLCFRRQHQLQTPEQIIEGLRKTALKLQSGKAANGTAHDNSAEVKAIIAACTSRLEHYAKAKKTPATSKAA